MSLMQPNQAPQPAAPNFGANAASTGPTSSSAQSAAQTGGAAAAAKWFGPNFGGTAAPEIQQAGKNDAFTTGLTPNYGGYANGANDFNNYVGGLAGDARYTAAPTIQNATAGADRANTLRGLGALGTTAAGGGVAGQAAQAQFGVGQNASTLAALQGLGAHRGGGAGAATAANGAIQQGAAGGVQNANAAAGTLGQMAGQASGAYNQGLAGLSGTDWQTAADQAGLQEQQNQINQTTETSLLGLGQNAQQAQLNAQAGTYAANVGNTTASNQLAAQQTQANWGLGLGAVTGAANAYSAYSKNQNQNQNGAG